MLAGLHSECYWNIQQNRAERFPKLQVINTKMIILNIAVKCPPRHIEVETKNMVSTRVWTIIRLSLWCSGSVRDSELGRPGFNSPHGSHCVIVAGGMCKLTVVVTSGWLAHY